MSEAELQVLIRRNQKDIKKKAEILLPEATFFAQASPRKKVYPFWLAGDISDARRVDSGIEGLSSQPVGAELYYIRIVLEIDK